MAGVEEEKVSSVREKTEKTLTIASPIPDAPPVTIAILFSILQSITAGHSMKLHVSLNPVAVRPLRVERVMMKSHDFTHLIQEFLVLFH